MKKEDDFKIWLCELAGICVTENNNTTFTTEGMNALLLGNKIIITLEILIKAIWAINKTRIFEITIDYLGGYIWHKKTKYKSFYNSDYNNLEQETLQAILKYIFNN